MQLQELLSNGLVALAFGGGLLPSLMLANRQALSQLTEGRSAAARLLSGDSPPISSSALLLYPEPLYLADVVAVTCRLPPNGNPALRSLLPAEGKLLRKADFPGALERLPTPRWPVDAEGEAIGGEALRQRLAGGLASRPLSPVAIDACWVALSGGSPYLSQEELARQLARWRPTVVVFELDLFERSLLQGRANILLGYVILFVLQALPFGLLVVQPLYERLLSGS
uniref:Uncharacterized protein n=1 Tax=Haptolina ericina TaxID=156174 RepID=A0A7S3B0D3_9EUKA|mmetsp:Transcript_42617/g.96344  ORF Transcript_42617/g.96344 Transcript_42617/m.96344 type:complete len:226 (+) Transcript_42617:80-757(+)